MHHEQRCVKVNMDFRVPCLTIMALQSAGDDEGVIYAYMYMHMQLMPL